MCNELIFIVHSLCIGTATLIALRLGVQALVTLICVYCLLANFFVIKQITLFGLSATCSDVFTIGATLGLNLLQEYYGPVVAKRAIIINFFILVVYIIMSQIHLFYCPSNFDTTQEHFTALLSSTPRIVIASFVVYCMAQTIDYNLYGFFKRRFSSQWLLLRNYASMVLSQLFDTVAFSFFGLYGIVENVGEIILISYIVKVFAIVLSTPFIKLSRFFASFKVSNSQ